MGGGLASRSKAESNGPGLAMELARCSKPAPCSGVNTALRPKPRSGAETEERCSKPDGVLVLAVVLQASRCLWNGGAGSANSCRISNVGSGGIDGGIRP